MAARRPVSPPSAAELAAVRIERVGAEGDGIGRLADGTTVYVPFTLPDELIRARVLGRRGDGRVAALDAVLETSGERAAPPCPHFGACGGCVLQHWRDEPYLAWKSGLLRDALRRAGYGDAPISPIVSTGPAQRRRMDVAVRRTPKGMIIGLHARGGAAIDLTDCHVLHPALFALLARLRPLLNGLQAVRREASVVANLLDTGIDLLLHTDAPLAAPDRAALVKFAQAQDLPRLSWARGQQEPEPVLILRPAVVTLSGVAVTPPPGAFLQATETGERAILAAVLGALPDRMPPRARIAEFHAGCGTLSFALVQRGRVTAFEGDAAAVSALKGAVNRAGLSGRVDAMQRDLVRQPVAASDLAGFAAVVLDPPHTGAAIQMAQIAAARPPRVIYVSCNPAALARDARLLHDAGYRLLAATPIDQFLWSARLESVCAFENSSLHTARGQA